MPALTVNELIARLQTVAETDGDALVSVIPAGGYVTSVTGPIPVEGEDRKAVLIYAKGD